MPQVKKIGIPLRAIPNIAYEDYLPHKDGICGQWIRPEDIEIYGDYIDIIDFYAPNNPEKEETLYHIYAENKKWPGNLNLLIDNLNYDLNNLYLTEDLNFANQRVRCKHICQENGNCHYCENQFKFGQAFEEKIKNSELKKNN